MHLQFTHLEKTIEHEGKKYKYFDVPALNDPRYGIDL